jgi:hypothetical protein
MDLKKYFVIVKKLNVLNYIAIALESIKHVMDAIVLAAITYLFINNKEITQC